MAKIKRTRRDIQKDETRKIILESAQRLFLEKGFDRTTIRMIASSAQVGLGTIFSHFRDKQSILITSCIDELMEANQKSWDTMPPNSTIQGKMLHLARGGYKAWLNRPAFTKVIIREMCFKEGPGHAELQALDKEAMEQLSKLLEEAKRNKELKDCVDPQLIARAAFSFYLMTVLFWLDDSIGERKTAKSRKTHDSISLRLESMVEETRNYIDIMFQGIGGTQIARTKQKGSGHKSRNRKGRKE